MTTLPDLVQGTKLETSFHDHLTVHEHDTSDSDDHRRVEYWETKPVPLASGGFGDVYLQQCVEGRRRVEFRAVKMLSKYKSESRKIDYVSEIEAIAKFSQKRYAKYFVKLLGWYDNVDWLCIAMEYFPLGDLQRHMSEKPPMPERDVQEISYQILKGLHYMHSENFAHRDIKPGNILIKSQPPQDSWRVKLSDFGISKRVDPTASEQISTIQGTQSYMAPELLGHVRGSGALIDHQAADMWSLGEMVFRMLTKEPVFPSMNDVVGYLSRPDYFPMKPLVEKGVGEDAKDFVTGLMRPAPENRLKADEALRHIWLEPARPRPRPTASPFRSSGHSSPMPPLPPGLGSGSRRGRSRGRGAWATVSSKLSTSRPVSETSLTVHSPMARPHSAGPTISALVPARLEMDEDAPPKTPTGSGSKPEARRVTLKGRNRDCETTTQTVTREEALAPVFRKSSEERDPSPGRVVQGTRKFNVPPPPLPGNGSTSIWAPVRLPTKPKVNSRASPLPQVPTFPAAPPETSREESDGSRVARAGSAREGTDRLTRAEGLARQERKDSKSPSKLTEMIRRDPLRPRVVADPELPTEYPIRIVYGGYSDTRALRPRVHGNAMDRRQKVIDKGSVRREGEEQRNKTPAEREKGRLTDSPAELPTRDRYKENKEKPLAKRDKGTLSGFMTECSDSESSMGGSYDRDYTELGRDLLGAMPKPTPVAMPKLGVMPKHRGLEGISAIGDRQEAPFGKPTISAKGLTISVRELFVSNETVADFLLIPGPRAPPSVAIAHKPGSEEALTIHDVDTGRRIKGFKLDSHITAMDVTRRRTPARVAMALTSNHVEVWGLPEWKPQAMIQASGVVQLAFPPGSREQLIILFEDKVWSWKVDEPLSPIILLQMSNGWRNRKMEFSDDGSAFGVHSKAPWAADQSVEIFFWDQRAKGWLLDYKVKPEPVPIACFAVDLLKSLVVLDEKGLVSTYGPDGPSIFGLWTQAHLPFDVKQPYWASWMALFSPGSLLLAFLDRISATLFVVRPHGMGTEVEWAQAQLRDGRRLLPLTKLCFSDSTRYLGVMERLGEVTKLSLWEIEV